MAAMVFYPDPYPTGKSANYKFCRKQAGSLGVFRGLIIAGHDRRNPGNWNTWFFLFVITKKETILKTNRYHGTY